MGFKCGIVGLPNVGKSTLFNALTRAGVPAANYPFCTIDPHVGVVEVPDARLDRLAAIARPQKVIPTVIEFVDIAGLVAGASKGEGLGNQFLAHIREVDAIAHVVRCFENPDVTHVAGGVNPAADIETIATELALADLETVEKAHGRAATRAKSGAKDEVRQRDLLARVRDHMNTGAPLRTLALSPEERVLLRPLGLLTAKPTMYLANVSETGFKDNPYLAAVRRHAQAEGAVVVPVSAAIEAELVELGPEDKQAFLADLGLEEPGLNRVICAGYALLGLITFFTAGPKEVRAWTVPVGTSAPQAAGVIHSDFERGFIRAEVTAYDDYVALGGEAGARDAGKLRLEGKEYAVQDGDVIHFRFNV